MTCCLPTHISLMYWNMSSDVSKPDLLIEECCVRVKMMHDESSSYWLVLQTIAIMERWHKSQMSQHHQRPNFWPGRSLDVRLLWPSTFTTFWRSEEVYLRCVLIHLHTSFVCRSRDFHHPSDDEVCCLSLRHRPLWGGCPCAEGRSASISNQDENGWNEKVDARYGTRVVDCILSIFVFKASSHWHWIGHFQPSISKWWSMVCCTIACNEGTPASYFEIVSHSQLLGYRYSPGKASE